MSLQDDFFLQTWGQNLRALEIQLKALSGVPPKLHLTSQDGPAKETVIADIQRKVEELRRLIKSREEKLAEQP